jgi:hypothetical protein
MLARLNQNFAFKCRCISIKMHVFRDVEIQTQTVQNVPHSRLNIGKGCKRLAALSGRWTNGNCTKSPAGPLSTTPKPARNCTKFVLGVVGALWPKDHVS